VKKCDVVDDVKSDRWYVVGLCVVHNRHPPNWIFEGNVFRPFHTLDEPITYIPTKFPEYILIGEEICPQNEIRNGPFGGEILLSVPILTI